MRMLLRVGPRCRGAFRSSKQGTISHVGGRWQESALKRYLMRYHIGQSFNKWFSQWFSQWCFLEHQASSLRPPLSGSTPAPPSWPPCRELSGTHR